MGTKGKEKDFGNLFKTIAEIGGYVSTLVPYILAILGKASIPYPTLIATLTFGVSVIVLWRWRWPVITGMKLPRSEGKRNEQAAKAGKIQLRDYFRTSTGHLFTLPLLRRRMEMIVLSVFAFWALGLVFVNFQIVRQEVTGFHCLSEASDFRVVITNFSSEQKFEDDLASIMDLQSGDRFQICRYNKQVQLPDLARDAGEKNEANLVIWGNNINDQINIYLTAIDWEVLNQRHGGLSVGQSQEQAAFLTEIVSSEILYNQGDTEDAQNSLYNALDEAETQNWVESNPALLAEGYLELGLLFDPDIVPAEYANIGRAIEEYSNAIDVIRENDLDLEGAYLNRALLYSSKGDYQKAVDDYTVLINKPSEQTANLYFARGQSYYYAEKCSEAIVDLKLVRNDPELEADFFPYLIHYLGASYLLCGDIEAAEQTYQSMPALTTDDVKSYSAELDQLATSSKDSAVKEAVHRIIDHIQQLQTK